MNKKWDFVVHPIIVVYIEIWFNNYNMQNIRTH